MRLVSKPVICAPRALSFWHYFSFAEILPGVRGLAPGRLLVRFGYVEVGK